jgi:Fe2+ or Zn2+ uptake regulation protein
MKNILDKLFCKHQWKTHAKEIYSWEQTEIVEGTEHWIKPKFNTIEYGETVEVLICEKCGKVHKINY